MTIRIATWNLNTWINNRDRKISNTGLWQWADTNLAADVVIFTEAQTPPPASVVVGNWTTAHRPRGFPGVSGWGTVIAARNSSNVRVERITHVGDDKAYEIDTAFPGSLTAADLYFEDVRIATVIGLHLRYRKDKNKKFIGHPEDDLDTLESDFRQLLADRQQPLIIAGDFNYDMDEEPEAFNGLGNGDLELVDTFENQPAGTFEQDWGERDWFRLDYMFLSKRLNDLVVFRKGGIPEYPAALDVSDHAPLVVDLDVQSLCPSNKH